MRRSTQKRLTLVAVLGMAWWFFGNLYEAIVFSPNWVVDSPAQFTRLNEFFTVTGPTLYFVPVTVLATGLTWILLWLNRDDDVMADCKRAGMSALVLTVLNIVIVTRVVPNLFGDDYLSHAGTLTAYAWTWNILNVFRMALTATTAYFLFNSFRKLDRVRAGRGVS
jgi:hypothetical protein